MVKKIILVILSVIFLGSMNPAVKDEAKTVKKEGLQLNLIKGELPKKISLEGEQGEISYSIDPKLEKFVKDLIKRYRPDHSSIVVLDNDTGNVLAAVGYSRKGNRFSRDMVFRPTHPAASLFKIITAAELLENTELESETPFYFNGKSTTLYRYQLRPRITRWSRTYDFKRAFALSNNVIFGQAAVQLIKGMNIYKMARKFGFGDEIMTDVELPPSTTIFPESQYHLAEIASGFNRETMVSPLHAALLPSIVANKGKLITPKIVEKISINGEEREQENAENTRQVIRPEVALELQDLMEFTVKRGTARSAFRRWHRKKGHLIEVGGKTGSITGGRPFGKRDWFVAYAMPKSGRSKGISIAVMNINVKKWYVKSAYLAQKVIDYLY